jgi:hypothetical protein
MMGIKMAKQSESHEKRRHALRNFMLTSIGAGVVIVAAVTLLNQSPPGQPPVLSATAGLLITAVALIGFVVPTFLYMKRTDEHDLLANLWGITLGWLFFTIAAPAWWLLNRSGLVGPVDFWTIYVINALVAGAGWLWHRFR